VPLPLATYMLGWTLNQHFALLAKRRHPDRVHIVRTEDVMADPAGTLGPVLERLGLGRDNALDRPSWNGEPLEEVYPWGTIRTPTPEANRAAADELTAGEREQISDHAWQYLEPFGYARFLDSELAEASAGV